MPPGSILLLLLILLVLVAGSFAFSAIQTALFALPPFRLSRLLRRYPHLERTLSRWLTAPRDLLGTLVLAEGLVNLPLVLICLALLWEEPDRHDLSLWASALLLFGIIFVLCDLIPKLFALQKPLRTAAFFLPLLHWILPLFTSAGRLLETISEWIASRCTPRYMQPSTTLNQDEMETLVEMITEDGRLMEEEAGIIRGILKLDDRTAKDYMVPRVDMISLADDLSHEEVLSVARLTRFRQFPVYQETPDTIIGVLDIQDYLAGPSRQFTEAMENPFMIPETMEAMELLTSFLRGPARMAVIVDEYGGTEGIVTLMDIVEDLIGDAVPGGDTDLWIEELDNGHLLVNGDTRLDDLGSHLGVPLEEEGIDTIGGLVFNHLGYIPKAGSTLEIPPLLITVQRLSRKRIAELVVHMPAESDASLEEAS